MTNKFLFIDTETTGADTENDRLVEVAFANVNYLDEQVFVQQTLFKPDRAISIDAMAVCHITNEMVEHEKPFKGSAMCQTIQRNIDAGRIVVAHNAPFDIAMLAHEGIKVGPFIDTLKVARAADESAEIASYRLQYLRYYFKLAVDGSAHNAADDVRTLIALFDHYLRAGFTVERMLEVSAKPSLIRRLNFGKHKDRKIEDVAKSDPSYLQWLLNQKLVNPKGEEDWIYTLRNALGMKV